MTMGYWILHRAGRRSECFFVILAAQNEEKHAAVSTPRCVW